MTAHMDSKGRLIDAQNEMHSLASENSTLQRRINNLQHEV